MAGERLPMGTTREILRVRWLLRHSVRACANSVGVSTGVVSQTTQRAAQAGLGWEDVEDMDDLALEEALYATAATDERPARPRPDPLSMHQELRRPGVTLELLHLEYLEEHPDGFRYTSFCEVYLQCLKRRGLTMRQLHKAGDKLFEDFSGKRPCLIDRGTGARIEVELFVAVLGASNYTYAEATATQRLADWIDRTLDPDGDGIRLGEQEIDPALDDDGDGLARPPLGTDNCPDASNPDQLDEDCDTVGNVCDLCPSDYDPSNADGDGDGLGDVCDPCDSSADPTDTDADGVPDVCDNCPGDPNADQRNCNAEMERHAGLPVTPASMRPGDACDPTPCPYTTHPTTIFGETNAQLLVRGFARVDGGGTRTVGTTHRFCFCDSALADTEAGREACLVPRPPLPSGAPQGNCIIDIEMPERVRESGAHGYRRMRLDLAAPRRPIRVDDTPYDLGYRTGGDASTARLFWGFEEDALRNRWPTASRAHAAQVPGVTWSFAQSNRGCTPIACAAFDRRFSSYFTSGITYRDIPRPPIVVRAPLLVPQLLPEICPECAEQIPHPWLGVAPCPSFGTCPPPEVFVRAGEHTIGAITNLFSPRLRAALADPTTRWIAPSDAGNYRELPQVRLVGSIPRASGSAPPRSSCPAESSGCPAISPRTSATRAVRPARSGSGSRTATSVSCMTRATGGSGSSAARTARASRRPACTSGPRSTHRWSGTWRWTDRRGCSRRRR